MTVGREFVQLFGTGAIKRAHCDPMCERLVVGPSFLRELSYLTYPKGSMPWPIAHFVSNGARPLPSSVFSDRFYTDHSIITVANRAYACPLTYHSTRPSRSLGFR